VLRTSEIIQSGVDVVSLNLIDARDRARFAGELEPIDTVAGHIPGARNLPFAESMDENGRWKSADELRQLWRHHLGDDCRTEWAVMCGSGVAACHLAISALEAGYREPRLYVGSWSEWITDSNRPIGLGYG
jgi:thiosulfate/3-mercaptopyruvate sulfurtransferase